MKNLLLTALVCLVGFGAGSLSVRAEDKKPLQVLIVGGGSSHDFERWFHQEDKEILSEPGKVEVKYTDKIAEVPSLLEKADVLYMCHNQPMTDARVREAVFEFADSGKGVLLVHPSLWYNWKNWPEYNRELVGGGSHSHDRFGEFTVTVTKPAHPIMAGVPHNFQITDELYRHELDPQGSEIEVLATGFEKGAQKTYPVVWTVKYPNARIACITLGHDGKAHELPAFRTLLKNAVNWVAGKE